MPSSVGSANRFVQFVCSPCVAGEVGGVLVGPVDREVHRHCSVDQFRLLNIGQQRGQDPVPGPVTAVAAVPFSHRLPGSEALGHIAPGDSAPIPAEDALYHRAVIAEGPAAIPSEEGSSGWICSHCPSVSTEVRGIRPAVQELSRHQGDMPQAAHPLFPIPTPNRRWRRSS
jgi:hypothetical protein